MWFGVLGPLQVAAGEQHEPGVISAPRLRALLAVLLWRANQPVPADELAELVWDGAPPGGAAEATRALVMRLRRQLDAPAAARIVTRAPGYAIEVSPDELDASWFEALTTQAGTDIRAGRWAHAAQAAAEALRLWRGTPLTDVGSQLLRDQWVPHLDQLHVQALEWRIEADLHDGRHVQLIPELAELTARHPLRENFHGQLMLALYCSGRQGEALAAYQRARQILVTDLGVEPGPGLQDLHQRMLSADPALTAGALAPSRPAEDGHPPPGAGQTPAAVSWTAPRQLPVNVARFTGRQRELARLSQVLARPGGTARIAAISGTAGVGKTALAVHWAHQMTGEFPDGQLFVNLRGFDPAKPPIPPEEAVRVLLEGLGITGPRLPGSAQAQSGLYHTLLAGKQILIVLDNALDEVQVRPLLPSSPACRVIVTSRSQLTGLVATSAATPLTLGVMTSVDAWDLSQRHGVDRLNADPRAGVQIIEADGRSDGAGSTAIGVPGQREAPTVSVPRQLPAPVACFTGRDTELAALTGLLDGQPGGRAPALVISAIGGTAGVGKTALAVQWAHQVAARFPDGQLYANLRGYDSGEPVLATDALAAFLGALGVPGQQIPDDVEDRARLYRTRLAGRRVLVLLDNVRHGEQVRPLLPGDPGCAAVVTSRDALAGLVATDGGVRLDLDVLPPADALGLLRSLIGNRADDDQQSAAALVGLCAGLPLALRIAAEQACARPKTTLRDLAEELERSRLDGLDGGEDRADIRAVFSWSLRRLPGDAAEAFALTGLHPGAELDAHACAALTTTAVPQARRVLDRLHRASLIQETGPGRYGMHDLLRAYACEQAADRDTGDWCQQRLTRLFDYYLAAAAAAMNTLFPAEAHRRPVTPRTTAEVPAMNSEADARAWLDRERANLVAVVVHCAGHSWPEHTAGLAATLFRYLISGSHLPEALTIYGHALQAARRSGDPAAEGAALSGLGGISIMKGHPRDAAGHLHGALERYRQCGDRPGQAKTLRNLGITEKQLHNPRAAASYHHQAIAAYQDAGDSVGAARALANLAEAETELGSYDQAEQHLQRALPVLRNAGDQVFEAQTLEAIGELHLRRGQLEQGAAVFAQALAAYRRLDHPTGMSSLLSNLGEVSLRLGEGEQAISYLRQALAIFRQSGHQFGEVVALRTLAEALHAAGQPAAARTELQTALLVAGETGNAYQQASIHRDLADSHRSEGHDDQARRHWQQALDLYTQLGAPEAEQIRNQPRAPQTMNAAAGAG